MNTKSVSIEEANAFMSSDNWPAAVCGRCGASLERGGGYRESAGDDSRRSLALKSLANRGDTAGERHAAQNALGVDIVCHDCVYTHDAAEFKRSGILSGSSLATTAMLRYDFEVYRPFFDAECMLTPTLQAVWEVYRTHPTLNDPKVKRAILVNTTTGGVFTREYGEDFAVICAGKVAPTDLVIEIFDGTCGYVGIDVYYFGREGGMWVQGKVRESGDRAWYGTCYADMAFLTKVNEALRTFIGLPVGYTLYEYGVRLPVGLFGTLSVYEHDGVTSHQAAWKHAEDNLRAYLSTSYGIPEFQPDWVRGSGYQPMSPLAKREYVRKNRRKR